MTQTVLIGLDGATFDILGPMIRGETEEGVVMPFLARFMAEGYSAPLRSTPNPLTPPAWTSMITGRGPGQHGLYDFIRVQDKGDEVFFTLYDFRDIRRETLWSVVSRQDKSVVSLNFPMMAPPPEINGSLIPGFTSWRHLRRNMTPATLFERIQGIEGFNPKELAWDFERENEIGEEMEEAYLAQWIGYHLPREEQWFRIAYALLTEDRPDLMAIMFDGTDKIQHQAWKYLDPKLQPENPEPSHQRLRKLALDYYRRLDGYLERLVEAAGPEAQVFMASDHGFTVSDLVVRINRYLGELGYLKWRETPKSEAEKRRAASSFAYLDWQQTLAYCPTPSSNGIIIRVADAPGKPGIAPEEYPAFREKLTRELYALKDPATGQPVIAKVMTREEAFPGDFMHDAPDLTLVLSDFGFVSIRDVEPAVAHRNDPIGTHHPDGIFLARGPGIEPGVRGDTQPITAVASTLLYSLGLEVPEDFEAPVAADCFTESHLMTRPVRIGAATSPVSDGVTQDETIPEEDKEKILAQLKMLGYLED